MSRTCGPRLLEPPSLSHTIKLHRRYCLLYTSNKALHPAPLTTVRVQKAEVVAYERYGLRGKKLDEGFSR